MSFLLKQRLIGAIVLVALGVIFIPMLLEGSGDPVVPKMKDMPLQQSLPQGNQPAPFSQTSKALPLPPLSVINRDTPDTKEIVKQPAADKSVADSKKADSESKSVSSTEKQQNLASTSAPADRPAAVAKAGPLQGWIIQVGSFSNKNNAFSLRDKLRKSGYTTQVERVALDNGETYRVRVGPYLEKEKAEANIDKLTSSFQLKPRVMAYP